MSLLVEKKVQIQQKQAQQLQRLAAARSTTENALIETALELLFRQDAAETADTMDDEELLRYLEEEEGQAPPLKTMHLDLDMAKFITGTPIAPESIRREQ